MSNVKKGPWQGAPSAPAGVANGGNPPNDGDMEARVAKLETHVDHIVAILREMKDDIREVKKDQKEDFRILFGGLIFVALGLAGLMAKGFGWL